MLVPLNRRAISRASTGIYAILKAKLSAGARVVVPANICYAAIFPVLYAGCKPVFCDVDPSSGNVSYETLFECLSGCEDVGVAVIAHMYGNPAKGFDRMVDLLHSRGAMVIEDCASSLGALLDNGRIAGFSGDYAVYSFGYSKTVDIGFGGLLASAFHDVSFIDEIESWLPGYKAEFEDLETFFSRVYRLMRQNQFGTRFDSALFAELSVLCKDCFIHSSSEDMKREIEACFENAPAAISLRREQQSEYLRTIKLPNGYLPYRYSEGAVPWRFSVLVPPGRRAAIIGRCLEEGIPISDWYPCIAGFFGDSGDYPGAYSMGDRILNLPIGRESFDVSEIAGAFNKVLEDVEGGL